MGTTPGRMGTTPKRGRKKKLISFYRFTWGVPLPNKWCFPISPPPLVQRNGGKANPPRVLSIDNLTRKNLFNDPIRLLYNDRRPLRYSVSWGWTGLGPPHPCWVVLWNQSRLVVGVVLLLLLLDNTSNRYYQTIPGGDWKVVVVVGWLPLTDLSLEGVVLSCSSRLTTAGRYKAFSDRLMEPKSFLFILLPDSTHNGC